MKYIVIELQDNGDQVGNIVTAFDNVLQAESKYHAILSASAESAMPCQSAVMLTSEGQFIKSEAYKHDQEEG